ncbi:Translational repressor [Scheffersomyces spartinae]|uniref:Translational repressor n=1 Tax=Scheffersomyces spartinae TaxID=45513 RepID=A0A9P8AIJ3_9ASCO|nr:Translational repressor [Scheffersomyces spartinae]KAG7193186.1 Translational repressor [Scheffersomyces spartinae]
MDNGLKDSLPIPQNSLLQLQLQPQLSQVSTPPGISIHSNDLLSPTPPPSASTPPTGSTQQTVGPKKVNLHIAHRRSPSELTTLMIEQYNLQKQLEEVQAQQKQLLQQQQHHHHQQQVLVPSQQQQLQLAYPNSEFLPPPAQYRSHSRSGSMNNTSMGSVVGGQAPQQQLLQPPQPTHRRAGSGGGANSSMGHNRRHSLGLNEAIKAAANQRQSNRSTLNPNQQNQSQSQSTGTFKFPDSGPGSGSSDELSSPTATSPGGHNRSRSLAYGQQSFKFPPDSTDTKESLLPPTPTFSGVQSPERNNSGNQGHLRRSSHYRSNSRNYDINSNWRSQQQPLQQQPGNNNNRRNLSQQFDPPPGGIFVPGHKNRSGSQGGSSISSLSQFLPSGSPQGNQTQGNVNPNNGRKSLFAPYLPQSSLPGLVSEGRLVTGTLRVNKKNRSDAYVSTDGLLDADIFICGSKDRNRALEGDLVAVELLVVDEVWESKKEKEEKKRRKDNIVTRGPGNSVLSDDIHNDATSASQSVGYETSHGITSPGKDGSSSDGAPILQRRGSLKQRPTMKKNDDVEVEGQSLLLIEEEEINDDVKPLYAGHVVAVVDRIPGQLFSGTLGLLRPAQAAQAAKDKKDGKESLIQTPRAPKIVWFKPTDKKVPLIAIPTEQAPKDFVNNHEKYADQLFVASIKRWPITSLHPFGTLVSKLGDIEDPKTEIDSILRDNNFLCDEYPEDMSFEFPNLEDELQSSQRVDYGNDYIIAFTQTGSFTDHALHVKRISDTKIELGFHVPDISYFIKLGSALDRKARKRSSSVFLPQKLSNLYPDFLTGVVSFNENMKKLAVSVVFEIDTMTFEVEDLYIHESIVVAKQLVGYGQFDTVMAGLDCPTISSATADYIKTFSLIAKEFRRQRLNDKSLGLTPNLNLLDFLDDEKVKLDLNIYKGSTAYDVITEISHKVNSAIAAKIHANIGDRAMLRRQALPTLQKMENFVRRATLLGFQIDTTDSASLQKSILLIEDPVKRQCVETLLYKCMPRAKYYIAGKQDPDSYGHYYLNLPLYTHFTAPLRRYADLVVHRQLKSAIHKNEEYEQIKDLESLRATADYCNFKKDCAANAQEQAIHLLLSQTINEVSENAGQLLCMGIVIQVYESSFDVFIPDLGVEKRVHGDQLPLVKAEFDRTNRILELYWERGVDSATYIPPDEQSSLSYRTSIKNKYRTSTIQAARLQNTSTQTLEKKNETIIERLSKMNLEPPRVKAPASSSTTDSLKAYLQNCITRVEGEFAIQEIRELMQVPVLLRAEIGMALPCLTVRTVNPFAIY